MKRVRTFAWKIFCVHCLVLSIWTSCRTETFWKLCPLGCPGMRENRNLLWLVFAGLFGYVENINLLPIVSGHGLRMFGHLAEDELSITCVRTQLLAVRKLCRKSRFLWTINSVEYFPNHYSLIYWLIFCNTLLVQLFHFLINIL
jgi:hypothetical protein